MCQKKLGDGARARQFFDLARRWSESHKEASAEYAAELAEFRREAGELLGVGNKND